MDMGREDNNGQREENANPLGSQPLLGPYDAGRMQLSLEERDWALAVRHAVEQDQELDSTCISDFMVAQIALKHRDDVEAALECARRMQAFREEHGIVESYEAGRAMIQKYLEVMPELHLSLAFEHSHGNYVLVVDVGKFYVKNLEKCGEDAMNVWLGGSYYLCHAMSCDLEAIRRGIIIITEAGGFDWKKNFGVDIAKTWVREIGASYPFHLQKMNFYHTGVLFNIMASAMKSMLPRESKHITYL